MNKYETPDMDVVLITARDAIANDENDYSVIISGDSLYPFPKN